MPETFGKYRIEGVLGEGAMGVVYKGYDPLIDRFVALKVVRAELLGESGGADYLERFKREARAAGRFMHPNIVAIYDFAEHDGQPYIAMEYVKGSELQKLLQQKVRFELKDSVSIILQVLSALGCAHGHGVVHRDVKPANVILLEDGGVKVADFGISRLDTSDLTIHGAVVGTPSYMSPEQCRGDAIDARSDLFSTGVVLYELLTGEKPFAGKSFTEVMYRLLNDEPRDLDELNAELPPALNTIVRRALAKAPADRFDSAAAFAEQLTAAAAGAVPEDDLSSDHTIVLPSQMSPEPTQAASAWDPEVLKAIEAQLAFHIGPMAKVLVRNAAGQTTDVSELYDSLSRKIPTESARRKFLDEARSDTGTGSVRRSTPSMSGISGQPTAATIDADLLDSAQHNLAYHIGPIAKVMVKRAAAQASSKEDFIERLAAGINRESDRADFLRKVKP